MFKRLIPLTLIALSTLSTAEIFKCVEPDGTITFSNNNFCQHKQEYANNRFEPLLSVQPQDLASAPPGKLMDIMTDATALPDILEHIGRVGGVPVEPIALDGKTAKISKVTNAWLELFNELVHEYELDYRQAYGRLYVYQIGSMGETIVHSPDLLRWYQSDQTWAVVMKNDDILLSMNVYSKTELKERLPRLVKRVRDDLGEEESVNAAESVVLQQNLSGGVGSGIVAKNDEAERLRQAADKAQRITSRRQSN